MATRTTIPAAIVMLSLLMTISCEENSTVEKLSTQQIRNYTFTGKEGDAIPLETAKGWITNYVKSGLSGTSTFFGGEPLKTILAQPGCLGIRFYYAIDDSGNQQVLLIGADREGHDILPSSAIVGKPSSVKISGGHDSFNARLGTDVPGETARRWITNYMERFPTRVRAHFFGHELLNQILAESSSAGILAHYALGDTGAPLLILVGADVDGRNLLPKVTGRVEGGDNTVGDASSPCPAFCP